MTLRRIHGLALVAGALALAASVAPASAYPKIELQDTMILSYRSGSAEANDLPAPPPLAAPSPNAQAATPKLLEPAIKGKPFTAAPGATPRSLRRTAPRG